MVELFFGEKTIKHFWVKKSGFLGFVGLGFFRRIRVVGILRNKYKKFWLGKKCKKFWSGQKFRKPRFWCPTIIYKIFDTNFSFHWKQPIMGKVPFLLFRMFLLVLTKVSFWE